MSVSIVVLAATVTLLRVRLLGTTARDRALNLLPGLAVAMLVALLPAAHDALAVAGGRAFAAQALAILLAAAYTAVSGSIIGVGGRAGPAPIRAVLAVWGGSVLAATVFVLGSPTPELAATARSGPAALGFWLSLVPMAGWSCVEVLRVCAENLRSRSSGGERGFYWAMIAAMIGRSGHLSSAVALAVVRVDGVEVAAGPTWAAVNNGIAFALVFVATLIEAVPVVITLLERSRLDRWSRVCRTLAPLWADLTAACPEIVYRTPVDLGRDSRFRAHRRIIEIRDCLMILAPFVVGHPPGTRAAIRRGADPAALDLAAGFARACADRRHGIRPPAHPAPQAPPAATIEQELRALTGIARNWPAARALVDRERARGTTGSPSRSVAASGR